MARWSTDGGGFLLLVVLDASRICLIFGLGFFFGGTRKKKHKRSHKSPNTPSYTYKRKLYQQAISNGIPFIVGVGYGGLPVPGVRGPQGVARIFLGK